MFSTSVFAQAAQQPGAFDFLPMLLVMFAIMYFLLIRPQNKRMKEHRAMVEGVKRGDTVVTSGGIVGKVKRVKDEAEVEVEIADGVVVTVIKGTLSDVRTKGEPVKED